MDGQILRLRLHLNWQRNDLKPSFAERGIISHYRKFDSWFEDFQKKLPSFVPMFETDGESINERGELFFALSQIRMAESAILTALKRTILILKSCFHVSIVSVLSVILSGCKVIFCFFVRTRWFLKCEVVVVCLRRQRHVTIAFHASAISIRKNQLSLMHSRHLAF